MYRLCEEKIKAWFKNKEDALLITGARQVGKTYIIRKVLKELHISYFEINFYHQPEIADEILKTSDIKELVNKFFLYSPTPLEKGKSVIFLDEVQEFPEIITKIKFLVDDKTFKYILSGSLLGVELKGIRSLPVGYLEEIKMYPLSFFEFALALGERNDVLTYLKMCYENKSVVDSIIHSRMLKIFYYYLVVGGMPKVVQTFLETKNLLRIEEEQKNILALYRTDFSKYEQLDRRLKIISIYDNIPTQLNKQNLKFVFTYLNKELKFDRYEQSFLWLKEAGVAYPCYICQEPKMPLEISKEKNNFKLFSSDVGLLVSYYPYRAKLDLLAENVSKELNNGALFESFVAQTIASGNKNLYYYKSNKIGEIDFLIENSMQLIAIEVKSGSDYKIHRSLDKLITNYHIDEAIVLSTENIEVDGKINYVPIYLSELLFFEDKKDFYLDINL